VLESVPHPFRFASESARHFQAAFRKKRPKEKANPAKLAVGTGARMSGPNSSAHKRARGGFAAFALTQEVWPDLRFQNNTMAGRTACKHAPNTKGSSPTENKTRHRQNCKSLRG